MKTYDRKSYVSFLCLVDRDSREAPLEYFLYDVVIELVCYVQHEPSQTQFASNTCSHAILWRGTTTVMWEDSLTASVKYDVLKRMNTVKQINKS